MSLTGERGSPAINRFVRQSPDGRLTRCPLKDTLGDAVFAVLCACGHNLRKILVHLKALMTLLIATLIGALRSNKPCETGAAAA